MSSTETAPPARMKERYLKEIRPELISRFGYSSVMQAPKVEKVTLNMGVGLAKQDSKVLKAATDQLAQIAGQQPNVRRARKSIAAFKLREGMPVGVTVTLRAERAYEFLDRLISIAIPRIRDFRGLNSRSFDGRGNYSMGVKEQIIFPEIDYDAIDTVRGLDITITTSAHTDVEAYALLAAFGMPFSPQGRPKGYDPVADAAAAQEALAAKAAKESAADTPAEAVVEEAVAEAIADDLVAEVIAEAVVEEIVAEAATEELAQEVAVEEVVEEIVAEAVAEEILEEAAEEEIVAEEIAEEALEEAVAEAIVEEAIVEAAEQEAADEAVAEAIAEEVVQETEQAQAEQPAAEGAQDKTEKNSDAPEDDAATTEKESTD
jgi:large subunit ribosomal protein L5